MRVFPLLVLLFASVAVTSSIKCFVCNSLMNKDCEDNYKKFEMICPLKSFGGKKSQKAIGCRINRQSVKDEKSVVRECAYTGSNVVDKSQKGSLGVSRTMTQCDQALCNTAPTLSAALSLAPLLLIFRL